MLPEMENRRGKLVVVFAGYQKDMEGLMAHNEGLPSRFPRVRCFRDLCCKMENLISISVFPGLHVPRLQ